MNPRKKTEGKRPGTDRLQGRGRKVMTKIEPMSQQVVSPRGVRVPERFGEALSGASWDLTGINGSDEGRKKSTNIRGEGKEFGVGERLDRQHR